MKQDSAIKSSKKGKKMDDKLTRLTRLVGTKVISLFRTHKEATNLSQFHVCLLSSLSKFFTLKY